MAISQGTLNSIESAQEVAAGITVNLSAISNMLEDIKSRRIRLSSSTSEWIKEDAEEILTSLKEIFRNSEWTVKDLAAVIDGRSLGNAR